TGYGGTLFVLKNAGDGTFLPDAGFAAGFGSQAVELADLNNDGNLDVITSGTGAVSTLLGNGDGTFQSSRLFNAGSAPLRMTVGDFNNDGKIDVAVLNSYTSNMMTILLGNGDGTLQA